MKTVNETEFVNETVAIPVSTAKLLIADDGVHLIDADVDKGPLSLTKDELCYVLPENSANRKWFSVKKIDAAKSAGQTEIVLTYKASVKYGAIGTKIPNEKLISYLPEDLQNEYRAIIHRAVAARNDAKAKPMTELEKAQARLAKAQTALRKLQENAAATNN